MFRLTIVTASEARYAVMSALESDTAVEMLEYASRKAYEQAFNRFSAFCSEKIASERACEAAHEPFLFFIKSLGIDIERLPEVYDSWYDRWVNGKEDFLQWVRNYSTFRYMQID